MLDSKIRHLKQYFGIVRPEDWGDVSPAWVLSQDGIGRVTLDHLRIYLAARGLTLKDDRTPEYWQANLSAAKIGHVLGDDDDGPDRGIVMPFTVYVDTAEQEPFGFLGLRADAADGRRPLIVPTEPRCLGRHPDSLGDYSLSTGLGRCHVERKSMADAHGTILGWDGRRERFESELENLSRIEAGLVVVECSFGELLAEAPAWGRTSAEANRKSLFRSVVALQQDHRVAWQFCDSRPLAERATFRWLERWHRKQIEGAKETARKATRRPRPSAVPVPQPANHIEAAIAAL